MKRMLQNAAVLGVFIISLPNWAWAAAQQPLVLDSITVTAQKVQANKQDVPSSISVLDARALEDFGLSRLDSLSGLIANIGFAKPDNVSTQVVFRGIGGMPNMNKTWNINVDGVAVPYVAIDTELDVERIEILRGAQGSLYGRNTHAGAINIITKDPGTKLNGKVTAAYERFNTLNVSGEAGAPINDVAAYRLAFGYNRSDGYIKNNFLDEKDTNSMEQFTGRGKLVLTPGELGKLTFSMYADKYNSGFDGYSPIDAPLSLQTTNNRPGYSNGYLLSPTITWEKDFDSFALTSITNYSRSNYSYLHDWDWGASDLQYSTYDEDFNTVSQELRFSGGRGTKLQWLVGAFGLSEKIDTKTDVIFGDDASMWGFAPGDHAQQNSTVNSYIASAFAQLIYKPIPQIELTGAARFDYEKKIMDWKNKSNIAWFQTGDVDLSKNWAAVSPSASIAWLFAAEQRVYASVARGFKAGDFNNVMVETAIVKKAVDPEYTTTYEVGYKGRFLDKRLELNAALFYVDWDDMQVDVEDKNGVFNPYQKMNAGKAHSSGMEVETRALLMPGWEAFANVGYMFEYEFDEFKKDANTDYTGNQLPYTNAYTIGFGSVCRSESGLFIGFDGSYNGYKYLLEDNSYRQPGYLLLNAKIGYESEDWDVYLYGRNLLDKRYATAAFSGAKRVGEPLVVGVQAAYRF